MRRFFFKGPSKPGPVGSPSEGPAGAAALPPGRAQELLPPDQLRVKLLSAVNTIPPLPSTLNELMGMLRNEMASAGQIAAVIERDSVLSGSVIRCVNSAYYGLPSRVSSIRHAVTLLGFKTVRNLALAFSMRRMMAQSQTTRALYISYSRHALGTAIFSQFLASFTRSHDPETGFAAGLFHDVGKLLILTTVPAAVPVISKRWKEGADWEEAEREALHITHSELSAIVLEAWNLPEETRNAVRYHHDPPSCPEPPAEARGDDPEAAADAPPPIPLVQIVHTANTAVKFEGYETVVAPERPPEPPDAAFAEIGLGDASEQLLEQFREEFKQLQGVFQ